MSIRPYITDTPTREELQVLKIINDFGKIRDFRLYRKIKNIKKSHVVALLNLERRSFIESDNGSKGSKTYKVTPIGIAYIEMHKARQELHKKMQRILKESQENYDDFTKERIKLGKKQRGKESNHG